MSLFKKKSSSCCCNSSEGEMCCNEKLESITSIKVLGAGCAACHKLYECVRDAVNELGLNVEVEYVTDMAKVMEYGVMSMPAIVVNEKVVSSGRILKVPDVKKLLDKSV